MKFTAELKERNRVTIPTAVVKILELQNGDFVEITIKIIKKVKK
jgi:bifunctional DNA-binding transcriptional regulator/antitoxin component of YhaV-PrlF toxin-antitoxin module